jgi:ATP-binding cassette subfamily C protein
MLGRNGHDAGAVSSPEEERTQSSSSVRRFVGAVLTSRRRQLAGLFAVQLSNALAQAAGVLLLVPLLSAIGVHASPQVSHRINSILESVGITPTLGSLLAVYVALTVLTQILQVIQGVLSTRYRMDFVNDLRYDTYSAVGAAEWRHLIGIRRADMLAALTSNVPLVGGGVAALLGLAVSAVVVAAQLAASVQISAVATGLAVLSGFALVWIVWPLARRSRRLGAEMIIFNRAAMRAATSFLDALKLVKAYGREAAQRREYMTAVSRARDAQVSLAWANTVANAVQSSLSALLLAITVYVAIKVAHVPSGSLLVVAVVFTKVVGQITSSQSNIQSIAQALPAFEEIEEVLHSCQAAREGGGARHRIGIGSGIELHDVHFSYPAIRGDRAEALCGVSLQLPTGSTLALAGPSGAGKTTLSDLVAGLMVPTAGQVCIDGDVLTTEKLAGWRQSVALVPQDPFMFHDTIAANLRFGRPEASDRDLWASLRTSNAAEFVAALPEGLETIVGDQGLRLSGGERQRLALARALLRDPDVLILDEATSSLDTENELAIREALSDLRGQKTMLLIAHRLSTVSEADTIAVLDQGLVVEAGTWSELAGREAGRLQSLIAAGAIPAGNLSSAVD